MKSKRIKWLDFAKGFTMLLVVICHSGTHLGLETLDYALFTLVMPIFFAISGFLYRPTNTLKKYCMLLYKKISSFVLPYIIFTFIYIIAKSLKNHSSIVPYIYHIYYIPYGYLWFLYALFFIFIIVGLMDLLHINLVIQISISILAMLGQIYLPWHEIHDNINPLAGILGYMICFYMGYLIKKFNLSNILGHKVISTGLLGTWIILIAISISFTGLKDNTDVFNYGDIITKLLSIPVFFALFMVIPHNKFFQYFDKYGKYTLIIYLAHEPIMTFIGKTGILNKLLINPFLINIGLIIISWYISLFICYLAKKFALIHLCFYPRKYMNELMLRTTFGYKFLNN